MMDKQAKFLTAAALVAMAIGLSSCGAPSEPAPAPAPPVNASAPSMVTYDATTDDAWRSATANFPDLGQRAWIEDSSALDCGVRLTAEVSVKVCSTGGKVRQLTITARTADADLRKGIAAVTTTISPDAEARDVARVNAEAKSALAKGGWTSLCPDIRCFKVSTLGNVWQLAADASSS